MNICAVRSRDASARVKSTSRKPSITSRSFAGLYLVISLIASCSTASYWSRPVRDGRRLRHKSQCEKSMHRRESFYAALDATLEIQACVPPVSIRCRPSSPEREARAHQKGEDMPLLNAVVPVHLCQQSNENERDQATTHICKY